MTDETTKEGQEPQEPPAEDVPGDGQQPEQPGDEPKTLTAEEHQEILNRLIPERGKQYARSILKDLGFDDVDALKEALAKAKELQEAQMTAEEKAEARIREAEELAQRREQERDQALQEADDKLIRAAFLAEAGKRGAKYPADAFRLADLTGVTISDGGQVEGVETAVQALVEGGRLPLVGRPPAPSLDGGAGSGTPPSEKAHRLTAEELEVARKMGVKPEDYAKAKEG